ncbi:MAG: acyl-CoA dehydrogenase family protein [Dehalococcoidia bacterium]
MGADPSVTGNQDSDQTRDFPKKLAKKGWLTMAWPKEYGGMGADHMLQLIFHEEAVIAGAPSGRRRHRSRRSRALAPRQGEQKQRFLPGIVSAEVNWVQGYSEPGAGSDLASLQTRAVRDGDDFILNGQKIWTSFGHRDWIHVLCRTDPDAPSTAVSPISWWT